MTIVVYRDGLIAADSAMYAGGGLAGYARKIARNKRGDLAGATGDCTFCEEFISWFMAGERGKCPQMASSNDGMDRAMIVRAKDHAVTFFERSKSFLVSGKWVCIGSGRPEASGACYAGADAITAVKAACFIDAYCGGDILAIPHKGPERLIKAAQS